MTDEEQDKLDALLNEAKQLDADRDGLLKTINDLQHKVRTHQSAAGVQQRHANDFRDKLQAMRKDKERIMPFLKAFVELDRKFDAEVAQKVIKQIVEEMNG